jgi:hypothetical protein
MDWLQEEPHGLGLTIITEAGNLRVAAQSSLASRAMKRRRGAYSLRLLRKRKKALAQVSREKQVTLGVIAMFAASWWRRANRV